MLSTLFLKGGHQVQVPGTAQEVAAKLDTVAKSGARWCWFGADTDEKAKVCVEPRHVVGLRGT